jgi:hypothetical protein
MTCSAATISALPTPAMAVRINERHELALAPASPVCPRIDSIIERDGRFEAVTGTASSCPIPPVLTASTPTAAGRLRIANIHIPAGRTAIVNADIWRLPTPYADPADCWECGCAADQPRGGVPLCGICRELRTLHQAHERMAG